MILRARYVLPIVKPPIENGVVVVRGNAIQSVGRWSNSKSGAGDEVVDLGDCILLPGLINAHCHLDYTDFAGKLAPPKHFPDWIKGIVALKAAMTYDNYARSWQNGARMLMRTGTTTVFDVEAMPDLIPQMWSTTPLRIISFRELICLKAGPPAQQTVESAAKEWAALPDAQARIGLSPHTPYTTTGELLRKAAQLAMVRHWPLTTHVAESEAEFEMFMYRNGPLFDWLKSQRDMSDCGRGSPVKHLERCGYLSRRLVAAHVNYLDRGDAQLLGAQGVSVVHCPRSHAYFRHFRFPREELTRNGVNLCLGTDSLASISKSRGETIELDLFAEMAALSSLAPDLSPAVILRMATVNAAKAIGREGQLGELSPGAAADLIAVPFSARFNELHEAVVQHRGPVLASMIDGQWALAPALPKRTRPE